MKLHEELSDIIEREMDRKAALDQSDAAVLAAAAADWWSRNHGFLEDPWADLRSYIDGSEVVLLRVDGV